MPGITGEELLLFARDRMKRMRRVLITGQYDPDLVRRAHAHEVMIKPVNWDTLLRVVRVQARYAQEDSTS
jgi:hypothetical protein